MHSTPVFRLLAAAWAVAASVILVGCAAGPEPAAGVATVPVNTVESAANQEAPGEPGDLITFEVFGMDCPGCHGGLENLVEALPGVVSATASWEAKRLTVTAAQGLDVSDAAIREAIARANFTAGERLK